MSSDPVKIVSASTAISSEILVCQALTVIVALKRLKVIINVSKRSKRPSVWCNSQSFSASGPSTWLQSVLSVLKLNSQPSFGNS